MSEISINITTFAAEGGSYRIELTKNDSHIWGSVAVAPVAWVTVNSYTNFSPFLYQIDVTVEENTSGSSITVPNVSNTNIVTSVDSDDVVDGLDYDAYGKTDLVVLNCQEKYFVKLDGKAGWYSLVGGLPDGIIVEDGEFASMSADVKLISGGIAGYIQQPQISKVYSYKTVSFDGVLDNGDVPDYNQGQSFAGPRFYETDGHKYLVVKLSYGDFYIYENGELKEHYDTAGGRHGHHEEFKYRPGGQSGKLGT